jgi:pimeloyl-ACP methyl ester carboxylesterase
VPEELDLDLDSGRLHAQRFGDPGAPLILAVHGLSANMHAFDRLAPQIVAGRERQLVSLDLRGRGGSDLTPQGTYGLRAHAHDVLQAATELGAERFDWIGWSMGALIGILAAGIDPGRIRTLGLIDHAGGMDRGAVEAVRGGLNRLDLDLPEPAAYVERMEEVSPIRPFDEFWRNYYAYEFRRTSKEACLEDFHDVENYDWPESWRALTMPVALVRCARPLNGGYVVPERVAEQIAAAVPNLTRTDVDADHFTVMTSASAAEALAAVLDQANE